MSRSRDDNPLEPDPLELDPLEQAEALRGAIGDFVRRIRGEHDALPHGQAAVLGYLVRQGDLSIADLARLERVRHQSMARTVKLLENQELVELRADQIDRRRVVVRALPAGIEALADLRRLRSAWIAQAIESELDPAEREALARIPGILGKLRRSSNILD